MPRLRQVIPTSATPRRVTGPSPPLPFVLPDGQITHGLGPAVQAKINRFSCTPNQRYKRVVSSLNEGRWPSSRTLG